jgi:predicted membrane chloride channel (bestrophin family)
MILYESGSYHFLFVFHLRGSAVPQASAFAVPSLVMAILWRYFLDTSPEYFSFLEDVNPSAVWSTITLILGVLIAFRTNRAYSRFWEGITLVQMMRAEWFEACSNLMAFSTVALERNARKNGIFQKVETFQSILVQPCDR